MKKQMKNFRYIYILIMSQMVLVSCEKNEINTSSDEEVILISSKISNEEQAPYVPGIYGPETLTAGYKGVFSYVMYPLAQQQIPSQRRGFRIYIRKWLCTFNQWELEKLLDVPYSSATLVFPEDYCIYSSDNSTRWQIGYQVYDIKTGEDWIPSWREVKVFN